MKSSLFAPAQTRYVFASVQLWPRIPEYAIELTHALASSCSQQGSNKSHQFVLRRVDSFSFSSFTSLSDSLLPPIHLIPGSTLKHLLNRLLGNVTAGRKLTKLTC